MRHLRRGLALPPPLVQAALVLVALLRFDASMGAEAAPIEQHLASAPTVQVRYAPRAPAVRAEPDDPAWIAAGEAIELGTADEPSTLVRLLWDEAALYVRFEVVDDDLEVPHRARRDAAHHLGDVVEMFVDPIGDGRQYFEIQATPGGGVTDILHLLTGAPHSNEAGLLLGSVRRDSLWSLWEWTLTDLRLRHRLLRGTGGDEMEGWIIDLAIPAWALVRPQQRRGDEVLVPGTLRAHFVRHEWEEPDDDGKRRLQAFYWGDVPHGCPHISPLAMGELRLLPAGEN